jgi:hypothetical protein
LSAFPYFCTVLNRKEIKGGVKGNKKGSKRGSKKGS